LLLPFLFRYLGQSKAQKVLDIGCGNGLLTREAAGRCKTIVGLDSSKSGIDEARINCPKGKFFQKSVYDDLSDIEGEDFDLVYSTEVIEHLFYPRKLFQFARRKLRKGGLLFVSTPYHGWLKNVALSAAGKWDLHHSPEWDGGHIKFWSRHTLSSLFREEGFEVVHFHGCGRMPYLWASMVIVGTKT
jgi:2-polyprenyl-3-methyl-5-hydroxy-6-metoxy-1,4-benzoquinol methylase